MEPTSRRQFLKRSSAVAAAAGVAAAVPAGAAQAFTKSDANEVPRLPDDDSVDVPVIRGQLIALAEQCEALAKSLEENPPEEMGKKHAGK